MPVLVSEIIHFLGCGLGCITKDELSVTFTDGQVSALAVVDGAAAQLGCVGGT